MCACVCHCSEFLKCSQLKETAVTMEAECGEMEADYQTQKKTYDLLPNADENIEKLQVDFQ